MPNACRRRGDMRYMGGGAGGGRASEREGKRGESKRGLGGRLFEGTEIATMADKMLMEEAPSNAGWTSTGIMQTEALEMFLAMYGSTDRCSSAPSP